MFKKTVIFCLFFFVFAFCNQAVSDEDDSLVRLSELSEALLKFNREIQSKISELDLAATVWKERARLACQQKEKSIKAALANQDGDNKSGLGDFFSEEEAAIAILEVIYDRRAYWEELTRVRDSYYYFLLSKLAQKGLLSPEELAKIRPTAIEELENIRQSLALLVETSAF